MSIVEKAATKAGVELQADALPPKQRQVKTFQRLIAAMRACEAEVQDRLGDAERQLNEALLKNLELQERVHKLEGELLKVRMKTRLDCIESLSIADKAKLLEFSGVANGDG
jgi:hypothetical protein